MSTEITPSEKKGIEIQLASFIIKKAKSKNSTIEFLTRKKEILLAKSPDKLVPKSLCEVYRELAEINGKIIVMVK